MKIFLIGSIHMGNGAAKASIKQMLGGAATMIHGLAELRNSFGSGHGRQADFRGMKPFHARLVANMCYNIVSFYLSAFQVKSDNEDDILENV